MFNLRADREPLFFFFTCNQTTTTSLYGAGDGVFKSIRCKKSDNIFSNICLRIFWNRIFVQYVFGHKINQSKTKAIFCVHKLQLYYT